MIRILIAGAGTAATEMTRDLVGGGCSVTVTSTAKETLVSLEGEGSDILILGTELPDEDGIRLLRKVRTIHPLVEVIMIVGLASVCDAVRCMKCGAYDCFPKTVTRPKLLKAVNNAYEARCLKERTLLPAQGRPSAGEIVGESSQIGEIKRLISLVGPSNLPVLILGETGTGKELIAKAIHKASDRSKESFVTVNAGGLPEGILESELFGHKKGAFTDARSDKVGLLEAADKGTFFGDEIGDMPIALQAKLLRVIETGKFRKLGDAKEIKINVRLVSATNRDMDEMTRRKMFRADLFYRLSAFIIEVPPLRERKEDIPLLIDHFLSRCAARGKPLKTMSYEALRLLITYPWPGNVRELANMIERAFLLSGPHMEIPASCLPIDRLTARLNGQRSSSTALLENATREHIERVLGVTAGNKSKAARLLGISRTRLYSVLGTG